MEDSSTMPTVSVMMLCYNTPAEHLQQAWVSLQAQTFTDWEMILADDASTDPGTVAALETIARDSRVKSRRLEENVGQARARNVALESCTADLVAILDSDDIALPDWLDRQIAYMAANAHVTICGCQIEVFLGTEVLGKTNHPAEITREAIRHQAGRGFIWFLNNPGVVYRLAPIVELGGYDPTLRRGEDYNLWMRAFEAGLVIHNQPDVLMRYRRYLARP